MACRAWISRLRYHVRLKSSPTTTTINCSKMAIALLLSAMLWVARLGARGALRVLGRAPAWPLRPSEWPRAASGEPPLTTYPYSPWVYKVEWRCKLRRWHTYQPDPRSEPPCRCRRQRATSTQRTTVSLGILWAVLPPSRVPGRVGVCWAPSPRGYDSSRGAPPFTAQLGW